LQPGCAVVLLLEALVEKDVAEPDSPSSARRLAELEAELSRARTIVERAADAIFHLDSEGRTTFANPAAEEMFGWAEEELLGRKLHEVAHYKHPDGSPFPMCDCPLGHVFSTGETLRLHEDVFWRRDGSPVPVACSNAAVTADGEVEGGVLIVRDITDRVRADEERKLLLNELNHRVKNTLSVVQSIARQTFGSARADARVDGFEARLAALSAAHNLLVERTWADPALREIAEIALSPFGQIGTRILLAGPEVRLIAQSAVALTVAFHELATNAAKYGALSTETGCVNCDWRLLPTDGQRRLEITWREANGPRVAPPQRRGFGTRMIEKALATEISGQATLDFAPEGVRCVIVGALREPAP
jgi:PAS domain S-box-containing protein